MTHSDLETFAKDYPGWAIWQGMRSDQRPGDYYANRRRWPAFLPAAGALTVAASTLAELEVQLKEQQRIEGQT